MNDSSIGAAAYRIPKTIGLCADRLWEIKEAMRKGNLAIDALDTERKAIEAHLIETLPKSNAEGVSGKLAKVRIHTQTVPQVTDWHAFYADLALRYKKEGDQAFRFLQRRVGAPAVAEIWAEGKDIPGVAQFQVVKVSLTKA